MIASTHTVLSAHAHGHLESINFLCTICKKQEKEQNDPKVYIIKITPEKPTPMTRLMPVFFSPNVSQFCGNTKEILHIVLLLKSSAILFANRKEFRKPFTISSKFCAKFHKTADEDFNNFFRNLQRLSIGFCYISALPAHVSKSVGKIYNLHLIQKQNIEQWNSAFSHFCAQNRICSRSSGRTSKLEPPHKWGNKFHKSKR